jgi:adenosine deaminase
VIHDSDAKKHYMLMVVVKVTRYGVTTKYLHPDHMIPNAVLREYESFEKIPKYLKKQYQKTYYQRNYENIKGMAYLHDPKRFDIDVTEQDRQDARKVAGI